MPRIARGLNDGFIYHVLNRGNSREEVFHKQGDYYSFVKLLTESMEQFDVRIFAYCLMPNHFHILVEPEKGEALSKFMQWLTTCHVRRYHQHYGTSGHVWQDRFKSFIVQNDVHLLTVARYIEGNPVRAGLVKSAKDWRWSSHRDRLKGAGNGTISDLPIALPDAWSSYTDLPLTSIELEKLRKSVAKRAPFGEEEWVHKTSEQHGLSSTLKGQGRPKKVMKIQS
ncbi:transposase, Y1_Tnp domain-containing [Citrifermentans bemidjiense Bem]|uniref:Transposase, Y1_Tnp domain-containing n=1 Tax=Citrifermentans bemidjiense (strain ATCC BAA-1014 / DSM 16622 / JCM 12645 / Bem) TaxID=404380 RepID=B5EG17_CITBB|nr:transposase [Citrifermentans bemidjiense]ACH39482.1 transposase, Y1_Tnp domain-containing [Citrifermentans bemidjiense Bem]